MFKGLLGFGMLAHLPITLLPLIFIVTDGVGTPGIREAQHKTAMKPLAPGYRKDYWLIPRIVLRGGGGWDDLYEIHSDDLEPGEYDVIPGSFT
jgi:hypothetical protein